MSRLTQALDYCNKDPKELTGLYNKHYMTSQSITPELVRCRKKFLRQKRDERKKSDDCIL